MPQTLASYKWISGHYVAPPVGAIFLATLAPADVSAMLVAPEAVFRRRTSRRDIRIRPYS